MYFFVVIIFDKIKRLIPNTTHRILVNPMEANSWCTVILRKSVEYIIMIRRSGPLSLILYSTGELASVYVF